jgi:hypothetical protein
MKVTVYEPPRYPKLLENNSIFLAGSIEMGKAARWQADFIDGFEKKARRIVSEDQWAILNPRRPDWDSTWEQKMSNANFFQQVDWELTFLERATHRIFYFAKDTISPISLLELGKFSDHGSNYVYVDPGYLRKGNVDIFCHRYEIPVYNHWIDILNQII